MRWSNNSLLPPRVSLTLFGLLTTLLGAVMFGRTVYVMATWEKTEATLLGCRVDSRDDRPNANVRQTHALAFQLTTSEGRRVTVRRELQAGPCPDETRFEVRYPTEEPERATRGGDELALMVTTLMVIVGLGMLAASRSAPG